jgi:hypothetical protein
VPYTSARDRGAVLDAATGAGAFRDNADPGAAYQALVGHEDRVLDTVDRVVNDARRRDPKRKTFLQQPLHVVGARMMNELQGTMQDLLRLGERAIEAAGGAFSRRGTKGTTVAPALAELPGVFMRGERPIYLGLCLLCLAGLLLFVRASGG